MSISGWNLSQVERLPVVADVKMNVSRIVTLSEDVRSYEIEPVMATKIGVKLPLSCFSVWCSLTVKPNSVITTYIANV